MSLGCAEHASLLVGRACYWHLKQRLLADGAGASDEERRFAGVGYSDPRPRDRRWRPADRLEWPDLGPLERERVYEGHDGLRALAAALRRVGEGG